MHEVGVEELVEKSDLEFVYSFIYFPPHWTIRPVTLPFRQSGFEFASITVSMSSNLSRLFDQLFIHYRKEWVVH